MERDITITHTWSCELKKVSVEPVDHPVSVDEVKRTAAVTFYRPLRPPLLSSLALVKALLILSELHPVIHFIRT